MTDNIATHRGFTRFADSDQASLHLLIKPDADLDSTFRDTTRTSSAGSKSTAGCSRSKISSRSQNAPCLRIISLTINCRNEGRRSA
jgi:hypothetical protein